MNDKIVIRNYRPEDIPALVTMTNEADACDRLEQATTLEEMERDMASPAYYPETDLFLAWDNGRLVGYADIFFRKADAESICYSWGLIHPEWRRRGLGTRLMDLTYRRATERLAEVEHGLVYFQGGTRDVEAGRRALLEASGMQPVRYFVNLARRLNGDLPPAQVPPGYRLRPFDRERDAEAVWRVDNAAFLDHWGFNPIEYEEFVYHFFGVPHFRPELALVAEEEATGQIVGVSLNEIDPTWIERTGRREGYIHTLAVLRQARRQGLGTSLLVQSLHTLQREGMDGAHLNADAENLTGAMRLYERVGFSVRKTFIAYRKLMRGLR